MGTTKSPQMLLGQGPVHPGDLSVPVNSLTGDLDALKSQVFVLKEGVEYKVKITFKVRVAAVGAGNVPSSLPEKVLKPSPFPRSTRRLSVASNVCIRPIVGDCVVRQCGGHPESGGGG